MSTPIISVIVPVYNVENYLETCVNSIVQQSYPNIEVLLINDGSTDKSGSICNDLQEKYPNISVIHKENEGLASVRNLGIKKAKGAYISFVDSDDLIAPDFLTHLYTMMGSADMAICDYFEFTSENELNNIVVNKNPLEYFSGDRILQQLNNPKYNKLTVVSWNKLYKKEVFKNVIYPHGRIHEDEFAIHHIYSNCNQIVMSWDKKYFYRKGHSSITANRPVKSINDAIFAFDDRIEFFKNKNNKKLMQQAFDARMAMLLYNSVNNDFLEWKKYSVFDFISSKINWKIKMQLIVKKVAPKMYTKYRTKRGFK